MSNKQYSEEFKIEAVKLAEKIGINKAAAETNVASKSIKNWIKKLSPESLDKVSASSKSVRELEAENRRLKKEIEWLGQINEVLKKSTAIFSRDHIKRLK